MEKERRFFMHLPTADKVAEKPDAENLTLDFINTWVKEEEIDQLLQAGEVKISNMTFEHAAPQIGNKMSIQDGKHRDHVVEIMSVEEGDKPKKFTIGLKLLEGTLETEWDIDRNK